MRKYRKIVVLLILTFLLVGILTGCRNVSAFQKDVYDNDSKIIKEADSFNYGNRVGNTTSNELNIEYSTFYGMETIWSIKSEAKGSVIFEYDSKVDKGKFKGVLITPENEVINIFSENNKGTIKVDLLKGKSSFKIVGNDSTGEVKVSIKIEGDAVVENID